MPTKLIDALAAILIAFGPVAAFASEGKASEPGNQFNCKNKKWIRIEFFEEPVPYVALELSDGRKFNLAQTMSASGVRYSNIPETAELWLKGNTVDLYEGPPNGDFKPTFEDCEGRE